MQIRLGLRRCIARDSTPMGSGLGSRQAHLLLKEPAVAHRVKQIQVDRFRIRPELQKATEGGRLTEVSALDVPPCLDCRCRRLDAFWCAICACISVSWSCTFRSPRFSQTVRATRSGLLQSRVLASQLERCMRLLRTQSELKQHVPQAMSLLLGKQP